MAEQRSGWGGERAGAGRRTAVPAGEGPKTRVTVSVGEELLQQVRARFPHLTTDQDVVRAAMWAVATETSAV